MDRQAAVTHAYEFHLEPRIKDIAQVIIEMDHQSRLIPLLVLRTKLSTATCAF
jgi:hypothetical protein